MTGAAAIMVAVFAVFGTLSMQDMQQMGVGLAVAVLLDATIVRMVLLPSVMALLGERNWRTPRWPAVAAATGTRRGGRTAEPPGDRQRPRCGGPAEDSGLTWAPPRTRYAAFSPRR